LYLCIKFFPKTNYNNNNDDDDDDDNNNNNNNNNHLYLKLRGVKECSID